MPHPAPSTPWRSPGSIRRGRLRGAAPAQRGVSSFAFQGTNAHVIAAAASASDVAGMATRGRAATWHRERLWIVPPRHPLLQAAVVDTFAGIMRFEARISVDHQAYLLDHRVGGRGLLPRLRSWRWAARPRAWYTT